jgi:bacillolysin
MERSSTAITLRKATVLFLLLLATFHLPIQSRQQKPLKLPPTAPKITHAQLIQLASSIQSQIRSTQSLSKQSVPESPLAAGIRKSGIAPIPLTVKTNSEDQKMRITFNDKTGTPSVISAIPASVNSSLRVAGNNSLADRTIAFIKQHKSLFSINDPASELRFNDETTDNEGRRHLGYVQMLNGIPLWGHDLIAHFDRSGNLYYVNGHTSPTPLGLSGITSSVAAPTAISISIRDNTNRALQHHLSDQIRQILEYEGPAATQYIWIDENTQEPHLVWFVEMRPNLRDHWYYFIDAANGNILEQYNATNFDGSVTATAADLYGIERTLHVFKTGPIYYLLDASRPIWQLIQQDVLYHPRGAIWTLDARNTDLLDHNLIYQITSGNNSWNDSTSVSAHYNAGQVFEYYLSKFDRKSLDGRSGTIVSIIHVASGEHALDNIYWNGRMIAYGDGGVTSKPLAKGLDLAAHEMTHCVIQNTVNLEYKNQSGALNESFADVFAVMIDRDNWTIGEETVKSEYYPGGALRNLQDPHNGGSGPYDIGWQPATMDEYQALPLTNDNGGVHINSGIPNLACYLIGSILGKDTTEQIYYRILKGKYLNQQATFVDLRLAAIQAAKDLYGADSHALSVVENAFDQVGIPGEPATEAPADTPAVKGDQWIAVVNGAALDQSLFKIRPTITIPPLDERQLTTTQVYRGGGTPISVSDNGSVIIFIDWNNYIRSIHSDGTHETALSTTGFWSSVSLSPGSKKLAATSIFTDSVIYLFDLVNPESSKVLSLYSPTTQNNVRNYTVQYVDALSWNLDGSMLLYDVFNRIPQKNHHDFTYWDINLLDLGTGNIFRLFPPQPDGVDLRNPSFANTNDNYIVFDYLNGGTDSIFAADLFHGQVGFIQDNGTAAGYPRYSSDDRTIVTQRYINDTVGIWKIPLQANKILPADTVTLIAQGGMLPIWFTIGSRPTSVDSHHSETPAQFRLYQNYPNPFNPSTTISFDLAEKGYISLKIFTILGQEVASPLHAEMEAGHHSYSWNAAGLPSGIYYYLLRTASAVQVRKMVLIR